jgi:soluble lytic murein transglycosylase-like protein
MFVGEITMLDPILAQLQHTMVQSVLDKLQRLTGGAPGGLAGQSTLTAQASAFDGLIIEAAKRHNLDPALLKAVVHVESRFTPEAVSSRGAKGLMQLMDATASRLGVEDPFDPVQNIDGGAQYLRQLLQRYAGDVTMALAAYNAGPGAVERWGGVPPNAETQAFVPRVLDLQHQYREWLA